MINYSNLALNNTEICVPAKLDDLKCLKIHESNPLALDVIFHHESAIRISLSSSNRQYMFLKKYIPRKRKPIILINEFNAVFIAIFVIVFSRR